MKLASYRIDGRAAYGVVIGHAVVDLEQRLGRRFPDLRSLLEADALAEARAAAGAATPDSRWDAVTPLPVIPNPDKIFCIGLNYDEHRIEAGREHTEKPTVFARYAASQVGAGQPLLRPRESAQFDYEAQIAVVIGRPGRRIAPEAAWDHIAGYACYNDASVRDWQRHTSQWTPGKNFPATGAFGPWMVTTDEIGPGAVMTLSARLNGVEVQRATTEQMIFKIPALIHYISTFLPLAPGDVIVSGTPGGVGSRREPPLWMKAGDVIEIEIDRVGVLRNPVADD